MQTKNPVIAFLCLVVASLVGAEATNGRPAMPWGAPAVPHPPPRLEPRLQEAEILALRERFNRALADRDVAGVAAVLASDYHLIGSQNSQFAGRDANLELWTRVFEGDPDETYVREPRDVRVFEAWGTAEELGDWTGTRIVRGERVRVSGTYAARWVRAEGRWLLLAEVFTAFACEGPADACAAP